MSLLQPSIFEKLPSDLHLMVLEQLDHPRTLENIILAYPRSLTGLLCRYFERILSTILRNLRFPEELSGCIFAIILAKNFPPQRSNDLKLFWRYHFEGNVPRSMHPILIQSPFDILTDMTTLMDTIDFFTNYYATVFAIGRTHAPLLGLGLQRALLRFQLCSQIFHQSGASLKPVLYWSCGAPSSSEYYFWSRFERVEVDDMTCVYLHLVRDLRKTNLCFKVDGSHIVGRREDSRIRGLSLLRNTIEGRALSLFERKYCQHFFENAYSGLKSAGLMTAKERSIACPSVSELYLSLYGEPAQRSTARR